MTPEKLTPHCSTIRASPRSLTGCSFTPAWHAAVLPRTSELMMFDLSVYSSFSSAFAMMHVPYRAMNSGYKYEPGRDALKR